LTQDPERGPGNTVSSALISGPARWVLIGVGFVCVALGALGAVLPLLPTTPFLLVAAREWRETRSVPRYAKAWAIASIVLVGGSSLVFFVGNTWTQLVMGTGLLAVIIWLLTLPSRPQSRGRSSDC
jgi:uncharacterized membrane protein YbaN (DUF454 family)